MATAHSNLQLHRARALEAQDVAARRWVGGLHAQREVVVVVRALKVLQHLIQPRLRAAHGPDQMCVSLPDSVFVSQQ